MGGLCCCLKHNDPLGNVNNDANRTDFIRTLFSKLAAVLREEGGFVVLAAAANDETNPSNLNNTATISSKVQTGAAVTVPRTALVVPAAANDETNPSNLNNSATISSNVQRGAAVNLPRTAAPSVVTVVPATTQQDPAFAAAAHGHVLCHKDAPQVRAVIADDDSVIQQLVKEQSNSIHCCSHSSSIEFEDDCPICLEEYSSENPKIVSQCNHDFHLSCIYEWMERRETCAVCRKEMIFAEIS